MKRVKNLYGSICDYENLLRAFKIARRGKSKKPYVVTFEADLERNLQTLLAELRAESWSPSPYKRFIIFEPKRRVIHAPIFRDRIVQHALMNIIEPIFDKTFIFDSYASRKKKGTHAGIVRLVEFLYRHDNAVYVLKCDVKKFFDSIDHNVLMHAIARKIGDTSVLALIQKIISNEGRTKGLTLGNYTSQCFSNIVLNELDYYIKMELRIREYVRYMDDFVILSESKAELHKWKRQLRVFLETKLKLELHDRKQWVFPECVGIDFLGYVTWRDKRKLRKRNIKRFLARLKKFEHTMGIPQEHIKSSIMSWKGYSIFANARQLNLTIIKSHPQVSMIYDKC